MRRKLAALADGIHPEDQHVIWLHIGVRPIVLQTNHCFLKARLHDSIFTTLCEKNHLAPELLLWPF